MKNNLILLVDADADSAGVVLEAAARTGHGMRLVKTSRDAFRILKDEIEQLDAVIIDVDPGAHGLALLEAISGLDEKPAVIVLTALEEIYMKPIATRHGAAACMGKPISIEKLKSKLEQIPRAVAKKQGCSCDLWGHPCERHSAITETARNYLGACHQTSSRGDVLHTQSLQPDNELSHASSIRN
jgi:DNA-binding NtrC family response regulator